MTLRCTSCSTYRESPRRKYKVTCTCGGDFERLLHIGNGVYENEKGDRFTLSPPRALKIEETIEDDYYIAW